MCGVQEDTEVRGKGQGGGKDRKGWEKEGVETERGKMRELGQKGGVRGGDRGVG